MLDIVSKTGSQTKVSVFNPVGYPPKVAKKSAAGRLDTLDGKTIYLVDCRFDDSIELLKQVQAWFAEHMPSVKTRIVSLNNYYGHDDPKLWDDIKANGRRGHPRRRPLQHLRACGRHARDHRWTANTACRPSRSTPTFSSASCSRRHGCRACLLGAACLCRSPSWARRQPSCAPMWMATIRPPANRSCRR